MVMLSEHDQIASCDTKLDSVFPRQLTPRCNTLIRRMFYQYLVKLSKIIV